MTKTTGWKRDVAFVVPAGGEQCRPVLASWRSDVHRQSGRAALSGLCVAVCASGWLAGWLGICRIAGVASRRRQIISRLVFVVPVKRPFCRSWYCSRLLLRYALLARRRFILLDNTVVRKATAEQHNSWGRTYWIVFWNTALSWEYDQNWHFYMVSST